MREPEFIGRLRLWARALKTETVALYLAAGDSRVPRLAKIVAAVVVAYALSPIDLIPDFIPILGYLDDLILVPLGIMLVVRLIPDVLMAEFRLAARLRTSPPRSLWAAVVILALWLISGGWVLWALWSRGNGP